MTSGNSLWQNTEDEPVAIRIIEKADTSHTATEEQVIAPAAARSYAALFGITLIVVTGFFSFGGMDLFSAQVGGTAVTVVISDAGITPQEVSVKPGQRITWTNKSGIPHILESSTLKDASGKSMETIAIFPGSETSFDVPATTPDGTYEYISRISQTVGGRIIVQKGNSLPAQPASSTAFNMPVATSSVAVAATVSSVPTGFTPEAGDSMTTTIDPGVVPVNPYTVGNTVGGPVTKNPAGAPIPKNTNAATVTEHRPVKQPESGMGMWIVSLTGLVALGLVMRRANASV